MKSALAYELLALGETIPPPRDAEGRDPAPPVREDIDAEDRLALEALAVSDAAFLERHPLPDFLDALARKRRARTRARLAYAAPLLAAGLALAFFLPSLASNLLGGSAGAERMKGAELGLFAYHKTGSGTEILDPSLPLGAGEEIQIAYYARGRAYAAILSVDGRGTVTRHLPINGAQALVIDTKAPVVLPYAYRLDDAPAFEDLYLFVSPRLFAVSDLEGFLAAARGGSGRAAPSLLPPALRYALLHITKWEARK